MYLLQRELGEGILHAPKEICPQPPPPSPPPSIHAQPTFNKPSAGVTGDLGEAQSPLPMPTPGFRARLGSRMRCHVLIQSAHDVSHAGISLETFREIQLLRAYRGHNPCPLHTPSLKGRTFVSHIRRAA